MVAKPIDVTCIGNAIVDVFSQVTDDFLIENGIEKGAMTLIDAERAALLYGKMDPGMEMSGGSAGNTAAGLASLGSKAGYIGKVHDDTLGKVFRHDIKAAGVCFETAPSVDGPPTARSLIMVTADAERSMNTFLGTSVQLGPPDVDVDLISKSRVVYLEGYLFDPPEAKKAFVKAARTAHETDGKVSLTLSDTFCVDRHRDSFLELVDNHVDILFANDEELKALYQTTDFDEALQKVRENCEIAAITRGAKGSVVLHKSEIHMIDAEPVVKVVDTTGAGDLYAAGFLHAYCQDMDPVDWGRVGGVAAAEIISHFGARPEANLKELLKAVHG